MLSHAPISSIPVSSLLFPPPAVQIAGTNYLATVPRQTTFLFAAATRNAYYDNINLENGPLPLQPETNINFVARGFVPTSHLAAAKMAAYVDVNTDFAIQIIEAQPNFVARGFVPTSHLAAVKLALFANTNTDTSQPRYVDINFTARGFVPTSHIAAARYTQYGNTSAATTALPVPEINFVARGFAATSHLTAAKATYFNFIPDQPSVPTTYGDFIARAIYQAIVGNPRAAISRLLYFTQATCQFSTLPSSVNIIGTDNTTIAVKSTDNTTIAVVGNVVTAIAIKATDNTTISIIGTDNTTIAIKGALDG